jgi:cytochrome c peroxidase
MKPAYFFIATFVCFAAGFVAAEEEESDPAQVAIGERLFLETRFAQAFFAQSGGDANAKTPNDPTLNVFETPGSPLPGAFSGKTMNCRNCHMVDEMVGTPGGGMRTYADFARRSPIPDRNDGRTHTPRNSPSLVNSNLSRDVPVFLHFDGEFKSSADLVKATLTGRNYGWLATERRAAIKHIAHIIRHDDGTGDLAQQFGGSYSRIFKDEAEGIPDEVRLPEEFLLDPAKASDAQIFDLVAKLISVYMRGLVFSQDESGAFNGSPYDAFLLKNNLPRKPNPNESNLAYSRRLRDLVAALAAPKFVTPDEGKFQFHDQVWQFGETELAGLKLFLSEPVESAPAGASAGNCIACHAAPNFTDFKFYNTGATQEEYDGIHGDGAFAALTIPDLRSRSASRAQFLPRSARNPAGRGDFLAIPSAKEPGKVDLGVWNVFGNPDHSNVQKKLQLILGNAEKGLTKDALLSRAVAAFKTPGLRDLSHSGPYLHTGRMDTLADVARFYQKFSALTRAGLVRNPDKEIARVTLADTDIEALAAFLRSLNEDYQ